MPTALYPATVKHAIASSQFVTKKLAEILYEL